MFAVISLLLVSSSLNQQNIVSAAKSKPSPSPTPSPSPSRSPTPSPTHSPTPTPSPTPKPTPTSTPTLTPTPTQTPTPTPSLTPTSTPTPTPTPTETPAPIPVETPTPTQISTPNPTPTPSPSPKPTPSPQPIFNSKTLQATFSNGSNVDLGVNGITALAVTSVVFSTDEYASQTTLSLAVIGQKSTNNLYTISVPKSALAYGVTPKVYLNDQVAMDQGFSQDANNYYISYKTLFSNYELSIVFALKAVPTEFPMAVVLSIVVIVFVSFLTVLLRKKIEQSVKKMANLKIVWQSSKDSDEYSTFFDE